MIEETPLPPLELELPILEIKNAADELQPTPSHLPETLSKRMASQLVFRPKPVTKTPYLLRLAQKIPLFSGFLKCADNTGESLARLAQVNGNVTPALKQACTGFQFTGLALSIVDFLRIPIIYAAAALVGEKPPITLSKNARWLYSGVLLGLAIAALAAPVVAVPLALAGASLSLAVSLFTLGKLLYQRHQFNKALKEVEQEIAAETKELNELRAQALEIEKQLAEAEANHASEAEHTALKAKLKLLSGQFDALLETKRPQLQTLYDKKFQYQEKLNKMGTAAVMDKTVAIVTGALAIAGGVLSIFFPPVGVAIIAATAIFAFIYFVARVVSSSLAKRAANKPNVTEGIESYGTGEDKADLSADHGLTQSLQTSPEDALSKTEAPSSIPNPQSKNDVPVALEASYLTGESTATAIKLLFGERKAAKVLREHIAQSQGLDKLNGSLSALVSHNDLKGVLTFFIDIAKSINTNDSMTISELQHFFGQVNDLQPALVLFQQAIRASNVNQIKLSPHDRTQLLACEPLKEFLKENTLDIETLFTEADELLEERTSFRSAVDTDVNQPEKKQG